MNSYCSSSITTIMWVLQNGDETKSSEALLCFPTVKASSITSIIGNDRFDHGQRDIVSKHFQGTLQRSIFPADAMRGEPNCSIQMGKKTHSLRG